MHPNVGIIGAGPSGLFAAFYAGLLGLKSIIFESLPDVGGQCQLYLDKPIYDIPGFVSIMARDFVNNLKAQADTYHPTYHMGATITRIHKTPDGWQIENQQGAAQICSALIIAAGLGAFAPRRLAIDDASHFEGRSLFYSVPNLDLFAGKVVVVTGGGDSAADSTVEVSKVAKKVYLVHRRDHFRAHASVLEAIKTAENIALITPCQITKLDGAHGVLRHITVTDIETHAQTVLPCDYLLPFFGFEAHVDAMREWGLGMTNKSIPVNHATMQTCVAGIYAIGDIASYEGKIKLIATGFAEGAMAVRAISKNF